MVDRDEHGWLGVDGYRYSSAEDALMSFRKKKEAEELAKKLRKALGYKKDGWRHPSDPERVLEKYELKRTNDEASRPEIPPKVSPHPDEEQYEIALSFAGEDRDYVEQVAKLLKSKSVKVFYDRFNEAEMWGKDLYVYLKDIYEKRATYTIIFASKHYAHKAWTNHERESAQARALRENREYILLARFDQTEIPGVSQTRKYISLRNRSPEEFANLVLKKLSQSKSASIK